MDENITLRKHRITSSLNDLSTENTTLFDTTMLSLRDTTLNTSQNVLELQEKLQEMSNNMESAHAEIENLNAENIRLKSDLQKCRKLIDTYKKINSTDIINMTPISGRKKKMKFLNRNLTPTKKHLQYATQTQQGIIKDKKMAGENSKRMDKTTKKNTKEQANIQTPTSTPVLNNTLISQSDMPNEKTTKPIADTKIKSTQKSIPAPKRKHKICIVSSNNKNKILSIAENTIPNAELCHYITPNCDTENLISNLHKNLVNYTMNDYCIIMIGHVDFQRTSTQI